MPEADVQGLSAYLGLLTSLLNAAPPGEASAWTQWLEGRYGFSLLDELAALRSCPVPAKLKASILDAIAATGRGSRAAADAWRRLEREAAERGAIGSSSSSNPAPQFRRLPIPPPRRATSIPEDLSGRNSRDRRTEGPTRTATSASRRPSVRTG